MGDSAWGPQNNKPEHTAWNMLAIKAQHTLSELDIDLGHEKLRFKQK